MQVAAGVQGHRAVLGSEARAGIVGQHVLLQVAGGQLQAFAQALPGLYQLRVVFQAGEVLAALGQQAAQMALARAPVQPVSRWSLELQAYGESADLLPLAPWHVDAQALGQRAKFTAGQLAQRGEFGGAPCQRREGGWCRQFCGVIVLGVGLRQAAAAQPGGQLGVLGLPGQQRTGEGLGAPQGLMTDKEVVQGLEAFAQGVAGEDHAGSGIRMVRRSLSLSRAGEG